MTLLAPLYYTFLICILLRTTILYVERLDGFQAGTHAGPVEAAVTVSAVRFI